MATGTSCGEGSICCRSASGRPKCRGREEEELREQREEAKRQAEIQEEQERHRPKLQEQERKWKAKVQGQREEERKGGWKRSGAARGLPGQKAGGNGAQRPDNAVGLSQSSKSGGKKEHCRPKRSRLNFGRDSYVTARETDTKRQ